MAPTEQEYIEEIKRREEEFAKKIPHLTKVWIEKARGIIREEKLALWDEIVPIRLSDLYQGMELESTLTLVKMLDIDNCTLEEAKKEFDNQGHSMMSAYLMFGMLGHFCIRCQEFIDYIEK